MFSKTLVVAALVAGALAAPSNWGYFFLLVFFFLFNVDTYPIAVLLVNAQLRTNSAATKSRAPTTRNSLRLLRASVSLSTLTFLSASPAILSLSLQLLATSGM